MPGIVSLGASGDFERRARIRAQNNQALEFAREAVRTICDAAGSSAHNLTNPIQRIMRDVNVMASHTLYDWDTSSELYGRAILGQEPNTQGW